MPPCIRYVPLKEKFLINLFKIPLKCLKLISNNQPLCSCFQPTICSLSLYDFPTHSFVIVVALLSTTSSNYISFTRWGLYAIFYSAAPRRQQPISVELSVVSSCDPIELISADNLNTKPRSSARTSGNSNASHSSKTKSTIVVN